MKRKLLLLVTGLLLVIISVGIGITISKEKREQEIEAIVDTQAQDSDKDETFITLEESRKLADKVTEKGRNGEYRNMNFAEFTPLITSEDTIFAITSTYEAEKDTVESIDRKLDKLKIFYGENLDLDYITDTGSNPRLNIDQLKQALVEGTYEGVNDAMLVFSKDEFHGQLNGAVLWIDTGMEGVLPSGDNLLDKEYYIASSDGSLDDVYMTKAGEISVKEAIAKIESYFNNDFPIDVNTKYTYKVMYVWIHEIGDGYYGFEFGMRRDYKGVPMEFVVSGTHAYGPSDAIDMMDAYIDENGNIPFFNGFSYNHTIEEIKAYDKILSPDKAMEYVSQKIGSESTYTVVGMELSYQSIRESRNGAEYTTATPVWTILAINDTSERAVRFYVNVETGEVNIRQM